MKRLPWRGLASRETGAVRRGSRRCQPIVDGLEDRRLLSVTVQLDYSLDSSGFFSSAAVRNVMQQAANNVAADLGDTLQAITPSGIDTWDAQFQDSTAGISQSFHNLSVPANTLIIYVFGKALPGGGEAGDGMTGGFSASGDTAWLNTVSTRGKPSGQYSTWGGAIAFDTGHTSWYFGQDPSQIGALQTDFLTVAEHEIGHVLGIGTSDEWQHLLVNQAFTGAAAEAAYGGPIPVDPGLGHWAEGTLSDGHPAAMDPVLLDGTRDVFTTLDYAGLKDVGWNVQSPVVQFAQSSFSALENAGGATITVTRTGGIGPATVHYATSGGTAVAGVDYTPTSGTLVFPVGSTSATFSIPLLNNTLALGPVTVNLGLSSPTADAKLGTPATAVLTINPVSTTPAPSAPQLATADDTGVSSTDGITAHDGSAAKPLDFTVSGVSPANGYIRLYANGNLVAGPVQASGGTANLTLAGTGLADGVYQFTATAASTATGVASAASSATTVTVETSLQVKATNPASGGLATSLPNGQLVVTFNHNLYGLTPDATDGSAFRANPFSVMLVPSGPDGGSLFAAHAASIWTAPSGYDSGDLPVPATLVYHENTDGTSQITLTPALPLSTDIYLISVGGLADAAGNALVGAGGPGSVWYGSFDLHASPANATPLAVTGVAAYRGAVIISNNSIPQPDTIGIAFNKALSTWTVNTSTIHLYARNGSATTAVAAAVAYSPSTHTAYLTPEAVLTPGTVYYVAVDPTVSDDQQFPNPGSTLGQEFITSFTVSGSPVTASSPLIVTSTAPANGTQDFTPLGYGSVTFSEAVNLQSLGRFSAMLVPHTGGLTTGTSGYADVPVNAKLAFNPNTNQLVIVPTQPLRNTIYLFALSGIKATNGDTLAGTFYSSFELSGSTFATAAVAVPGASAPLTVAKAVARPSGVPWRFATPVRQRGQGRSINLSLRERSDEPASG